MNRRDALHVLAAGAFIAPFAAANSPPRTQRIAWLSSSARSGSMSAFDAFRDGMAALGYILGKNLTIDEGWGEASTENTDRLAMELAARSPAVIVTQGPALFSAHKSAGSTPVVFAFSGDPVAAKIVRSLARPGVPFTGISFLALDLVAKRVDFLHEILPGLSRVAVIANPNHPGDTSEFAVSQKAASRYGMEVSYHRLRNDADLESAFAGIKSARAEAAIIHPNAGMLRYGKAIAEFSVQHRVPTVSGWAGFVEGGNLFSYGPKLEDGFRRLAYFVDRIVKGANPAELPIELPRMVELVINLRTARQLGIALPPTLLERADRMIR